MAQSNHTTVEKIGRRYYLRNLPFAAKDAARNAGCRWDPDQRAWWTGKRDVAESVVASVGSAANQANQAGDGDRKAPGKDATVAGRVSYQGRTYYLAGRIARGRTRWDDEVEPISTPDGAKYLLYFRDGSSSFWAARSEVQVLKSYRKPQTIGGLAEFAKSAQKGTAGDCAECGRSSGSLVDAADSSGIVAGVCRRCASMPAYERSYA